MGQSSAQLFTLASARPFTTCYVIDIPGEVVRSLTQAQAWPSPAKVAYCVAGMLPDLAGDFVLVFLTKCGKN
jgi:hypothetical protein